mgnify:CR=1 FL=1
MLRIPDLREARTVRVHSIGRIEVDVDLGLGVRKNHIFSLEGFSHRDVEDPNKAKACHCLVVLIGGKRLLVQPEHLRPDARRARLFLAEKVHGSPVGLVQHAPGLTKPILDISVFLSWLSASDFEIAKVHEVVNGRSK